MFKPFFSHKMTAFKNAISQLKNYLKLVSTIFPTTSCMVAIMLFVVVFNYIIPGAILDKISTNICTPMLDLLSNTLSKLFEFVFNHILTFLLVGTLLLLSSILRFIERHREKARFPIIGIPNKDNVTVLLALFEIRCEEIARIYSIIRYKQKKADKGNWIELFLSDYFEHYNVQYYQETEKQEEKRRKNKEEITTILKEHFVLSSWDDNIVGLKNLMVALKLEFHIHNTDALQRLQTYGVLSNTISSLIKEYEKFNSRSSSIFIHNKSEFNFLKYKIFKSDENIDKIWTELLFSLKAALMFLKMQNDTHFNIEGILKEVNGLIELQGRDAIRAITKQENINKRDSLFAPSKEIENLIVSKREKSPINMFY